MAKTHTQYGEPKKPRQLVLTDTASGVLERCANDCGLSRSEFMEQLLRSLDAVGGFWVQGLIEGAVELQEIDNQD